jgi:uncharacterized protein YaiL (DUF2058 family)
MGESLKDQLRALGLASEKPVGRDRPRGRGPRVGRKGGAPPQPKNREPSLDEAWALRDREERRQAERSRQAKLAEDRRRREINGRIRGIVEADRLNRDNAQVPRHFLFKGRIRRIYVTAEQQRALARGTIGIVYLSGGYHLLDAEAVEAVRRISDEHVVNLEGEEPREEDHPVPDDLVW